jgi:hypothetical protein
MKLKNLLFLCFMLLLALPGFSQQISIAGQFGYASPTGNLFENAEGNKITSFGIFYNLDALYHFDRKLAAGITIEGNVFFTSESSLGMFGLALYGLKGYYRFFESAVSPYASLSLGLSQYSTPDVTSGGNTVKGDKSNSFGIRPEIGIELGEFILATSYFFPMEYELPGIKGKAGAWQFSLGYRYFFEF